jgi:hypothetical protein
MKSITKRLLGMVLLSASTCFPVFAGASTLTFDDIGGDVPNGYGGLNWSNFGSYNTSQATQSGYVNGVVSPTNVIYNGYGSPAEVSSSTPFNLNSIYLTAAWNNGLTVDVTAYLAGQQVESTTFTLDTNGPTLETFDWKNIDRVRFVSSGGTHAGYSGYGLQFAVDNMTINNAVPEPTTVALLSLGLLGFRASRRKLPKNQHA